jgi:GAF domain-containing protein
VASEAGTAFDPKVVQALQARYRELEARAKEMAHPGQPPLSIDIKITKGSAPAAGFESEGPQTAPPKHPVAQARANRQTGDSRLDMPVAGVCSLQWEEALTVAALRIQRQISYDAVALCACEDDFVRVKFTRGEDSKGLDTLVVRQGEGLIGWVAEVGKPILNGNPAVEPGYSAGYSASGLSSALALPLVSAGRVVGVIALYRRERDAFAADELVALLELCPALASLMLDQEREDDQPASNLIEMAKVLRRDGENVVSA